MSPSRTSLAAFFQGHSGEQHIDQLDIPSVPRHVAIIMDGNGRWAAKRSLPRLAGHRAGAKAVRETILAAIELGVEYLTIYSFSSENWSRPAEEVSGLMDLFVEVLERELDNLQQMNVRVVVAGRTEALPPATAEAFARCERQTRDNEALTLVVALNYGGRAEIIDAVRAIADEVREGTLDPADISDAVFASHLYASVPDPDLVIRTSGEIRISNFLLWQVAYAELWVTDTLWPDFDRSTFLEGLLDFQARQRRFGGR